MSKAPPKKLSRLALLEQYKRGENITALLRGDEVQNSEEMIEVAYDLQTGSYVSALQDESTRLHKQQYGREIASIISEFGETQTIMEAGVGEATTLSFVLQQLDVPQAFGFDISWSRLCMAKEWLEAEGLLDRCNLFTGSLFEIPLPDNSIDVVYTSHSIEPNGGHEEAALRELYRVAGKWLILLEPAFDLAEIEAKQRMQKHGYCINLFSAINSLGYDVVRHELFPLAINPLNPTGITIIRKPEVSRNPPALCCPVTRGELVPVNGAMFSPQHLAAYPVLEGIPCLRSENAIVASRLLSTTDKQ